MKIYRVSMSLKILASFFALFITVIGILILFVWDREAILFKRAFVLFGILFFACIPCVASTIKLIIDEEKIVSIGIFNWQSGIFWSDIIELTSWYVLFPEGGYITLKPRPEILKKPVSIPLDGMSLDLVKDILSHLPPDCKIYLYPYLKRKLEGKQTWFYVK